MEEDIIKIPNIKNTRNIHLISMYMTKTRWLDIIRYSKKLQERLKIPFDLYQIFHELVMYRGELNEDELLNVVRLKYPKLFKDEVINSVRRFIYDKQHKAFSKVKGTTLRGHSGPVLALIQTSDGKLVSSSLDKTIKIWNMSNLLCEYTLEGHEDDVSCLIELNNNVICSGSDDKTVRVWNLEQHICVLVLRGHTDIIFCMCKIDNCVLATGSEDETIKIWDIIQNTCLCTLHGHSSSVTCLTSNENRLLSGSCDENILLWSVNYHSILDDNIIALTGHTGTVYSIIFLSPEQILSGSEDKTIKRWDLLTRNCLQNITNAHLNDISCLIKVSDTTFFSASIDEGIKYWSINCDYSIYELRGHDGAINSIVSLSSGLLCSGSEDGNIRVWKISEPSTEFSMFNGIEGFVELNQYGLIYKHIKIQLNR